MLIVIPSFLNPQTEMVDELVDRVKRFHIIRVRGVPGSGKTTLMMSPKAQHRRWTN